MSNVKLITLEVRENRKEIEEIARRTGIILRENHQIKVSIDHEESYLPIATFAYVFLFETALYLSKNKEKDKEIRLNLFDLFDVGISYEQSDKAEKDGNFTPFAVPGKEFINLLEKAVNQPTTESEEE